MVSIPEIATYISYVIVVLVYAIKVVHIARMPVHLRWELYPVVHEKAYRYGGSYLEEPEWWTKSRQKHSMPIIGDLLGKYVLFKGYFQKKRGYWLALYPWHVGFYLIVAFDVLIVVSGIVMAATNVNITSESLSALYYLALVLAIASFVTGIIGSIGMLVKRLSDRDMRAYAAPINYFNYIFFLIVFISLLVSLIEDPTLSAYREFFKGVVTFSYAPAEPATYTHVILFSLFLIYLPFTRSTHYITKLYAFFNVRWDDTPNTRGSKLESKIKEALNQQVSWSAPHIKAGKKWSELAQEVPQSKPVNRTK